MSENYQWDDFQWVAADTGRRLACFDSDELLFEIQIDAGGVGAMEKQALIVAYFAGRRSGERSGRGALQYEICKLIGAIP